MQTLKLAIVDLDNTLYAADQGVFERMDRRMTAFIMRELAVSHEEADALRLNYWQQYGTTLRGLMWHHGVEPEPFLHEVHDIQAYELLQPNQALNDALTQLAVRKVIHTNGTKEHAQAILQALGVAHHFSEIYDIRFHAYTPKPCKDTLSQLLQHEGVSPQQVVVLDDMEDNLQVAQELGARTCWVSNQQPNNPRWDWHITHIEACTCLN